MFSAAWIASSISPGFAVKSRIAIVWTTAGPGIDPEAALRLMLAGFLLGIVHDRKLMREAQVNLAIRWFAGYQLYDQLPDHSSLTRLRQRWGEARFRRLFEHTVTCCIEGGLVAGDVIHVDATLVRANVSLDSLVRRHIEEVWVANAEGALLTGPPHVKRRPHVVSTTDPDCAMATSSRRTFTEPSYKQHVAVDDQARIIVDVVVTPGDVNEGNLIEQHVVKIEQLTGHAATTVTADAGYAYGKVYAALEGRGIDPISSRPRRSRSHQESYRCAASNMTPNTKSYGVPLARR